jgi:uracil-DNA glycosylase/predicted nuclease with RNAse H fold
MTNKKERLNEPHIRPLTELVERWRANLPAGHHIPYFDPCGGGINAQILFLMEKPGPGPNQLGVDFVSQDNDDATARNMTNILAAAGIERAQAVFWNAIPAWNGTTDITPAEKSNARKVLPEFLERLPHLRVVVCVGRNAQKLINQMPGVLPRSVRRFDSYHPSPKVKGHPERYESIGRIWKEAADATKAHGGEKPSTIGEAKSKVFIGIDVGGNHFHVVALRPEVGFVHAERFEKPCEVLQFLIRIGGPDAVAVVAVDSPCKWALGGRNRREAERSLGLERIQSFSTPEAEVARENAFYGWVRNGMSLYEVLRSSGWPLFLGEKPTDSVCIETFPHAVTCYIAGEVLKKSQIIRTLFLCAATGFPPREMLNLKDKDFVDAALCSIAAIAFHRGEHHVTESGCPHGNADEGYIVVPRRNWCLH